MKNTYNYAWIKSFGSTIVVNNKGQPEAISCDTWDLWTIETHTPLWFWEI